MAVGTSFSLQPRLPKIPRSSFRFYKFSYTFICVKICGHRTSREKNHFLKRNKKKAGKGRSKIGEGHFGHCTPLNYSLLFGCKIVVVLER